MPVNCADLLKKAKTKKTPFAMFGKGTAWRFYTDAEVATLLKSDKPKEDKQLFTGKAEWKSNKYKFVIDGDKADAKKAMKAAYTAEKITWDETGIVIVANGEDGESTGTAPASAGQPAPSTTAQTPATTADKPAAANVPKTPPATSAPTQSTASATPKPAATPAADQPKADPAAKSYEALLAGMQDPLKALEAGNPAAAGKIRQVIDAAAKYARPGEYPKAVGFLKEAGKALGAAPLRPASPATEAVAPKPQEPKPAKAGNLQAEWTRRVTALEPQVLDAKKKRPNDAKWMTMFMSAQDLGGEGDYEKSFAILDKIEALLDGPAPSKEKSPELTAALNAWNAARDNAVKQLLAEIAEIVADNKRAMAEANKGDASGGEAKRFDILASAAEIALRALVKQLSGPMETKQKAEEMKAYLEADEDETLADLRETASVDVKKPLVDALDPLKELLPA